MSRQERLLSMLTALDMSDILKLIKLRAQYEYSRADALREAGYTRVKDESVIIDAGDALYMPDGREVANIGGHKWVLPQLDAAYVITASAAPDESLSAITCPQITAGHVCGGSLQQSGICPRCELGKQGYLYRYTCESCGYDIATREQL